MAKIYVVEGGKIKLTPTPDWSWHNWDGIIKLKSNKKICKIKGKYVITENDVPDFPYKSKKYKAKGFSDIPGMISSLTFTLSLNAANLTRQKTPDGKILTSKTKGNFIVKMATPPAMNHKAKNIPPIPDVIFPKTGTWKVVDTGQSIQKQDTIKLSELEETDQLSIEYLFDDDSPVDNFEYQIYIKE